MIRAKQLRDQSIVIMEDGILHKFDISGSYIGEAQRLPQYLEGMQSYPIVSLLSSGGNLQMGLFYEDDTFREIDLGTMTMGEAILSKVSKLGFFRTLKRNGECNGIRFTQGLFLFKRGTDLNTLLN